MNLEFLQKEIIPQRTKEIDKGENAATRQPIYVVLSMQENYVSGHTEMTPSTNYRGWSMEFGYIDRDLDSELCEFKKSDKRMKRPESVTKFFTERITAFFLTRKAAKEYLSYQKHNLSDGYIYTFYSGYANREMDSFLNGL